MIKRILRDLLRKKPQKFLDKKNNLLVATAFISANDIIGDYYEFGVFKGKSFITASKLYQKHIKRLAKNGTSEFGKQRMHYFAFDSFEGLPVKGVDQSDIPQHWKGSGVMSYPEAEFLGNLKSGGVPVSQVTTVKGFYNESLKPELIKDLNMRPASIIHIDCDLYESTRDVFGFITPLIQDGTVLIFDDYFYYRGHPNKGERGAFNQWLKENPHFISTELCKFYPSASFIINIQE
ncbi:MAG: hypothetical protein JJ975_06475 [Bacteroidia bacterium]|nr:hypothetical protein [Bacteroidia bacterium]